MVNDRQFWGPRTPAILFLIACAGFAFGGWAFLPMLRVEAGRLPAWQLSLIAAADASGLVLFLHTLLRCRAQGPDSRDPKSRPYQKRVLSLYLTSFGIPWLIGLAVSLSLRDLEREEFRRALVAVGEVRAVEKWEASKGMCKHRYVVRCQFKDAAGAAHKTEQMIDTDKYGDFEPDLPQAAQQALRAGRAPFNVRVAYRPEAPEQAWLADLGPGAGWNLHRFSLQILWMQAFMMGVLVIFPLMTCAEAGNVVQWRESIASIPLPLMGAVPLLIEALDLAFMGYTEVSIFHRVL
jgi:hypothetical protein